MEINGLQSALSCWHAHIRFHWSLWQVTGEAMQIRRHIHRRGAPGNLFNNSPSATLLLLILSSLFVKQFLTEVKTLQILKVALRSGWNSCSPAWMIPDLWPSLKGSGRGFSGFGIRFGGWMTAGQKAGSVSRYTFRSEAATFHAWSQ